MQGEICRAAVEAALALGRPIDTAAMYGNEEAIGAVFETLEALRGGGGGGARTRAIGVCDFMLALLKTAIEEIGAPIACNQIECHVLLGQRPIRQHLA